MAILIGMLFMTSPGINDSFPKINGKLNTSILVDLPKYKFVCFFNIEFGCFLFIGTFN